MNQVIHTDKPGLELLSGCEAFENKLSELLCDKTIDEAPEILEQFGEVSFCDEKIDDGSDDEDDNYVMMRSYDVGEHHVRIYFGDNSRTIGCVEVESAN